MLLSVKRVLEKRAKPSRYSQARRGMYCGTRGNRGRKREGEGGERESEKESGRKWGGRRREREGGKEKENEAECTTFELLSQWQSTNYS